VTGGGGAGRMVPWPRDRVGGGDSTNASTSNVAGVESGMVGPGANMGAMMG